MMFTPAYITDKKFLPANQVIFDAEKTTKFSGMDNEELYTHSLETMPDDWEYRHYSVKYTYNSDYYRTIEFDTVDWSNSIVLFGCSNVFGVGVDDSATISSQLQDLTNIPVINLGMGATSMVYAYYNQLVLYALEHKPLAVVNVWSALERMSKFTHDGVTNCGHWNLPTSESFVNRSARKLSHNEIDSFIVDASVNSHFARSAANIIWKDTAYYECSYFHSTADYFNIPRLQRVDFARDLGHPGVKSHELAAIQIAQSLNLV